MIPIDAACLPNQTRAPLSVYLRRVSAKVHLSDPRRSRSTRRIRSLAACLIHDGTLAISLHRGMREAWRDAAGMRDRKRDGEPGVKDTIEQPPIASSYQVLFPMSCRRRPGAPPLFFWPFALFLDALKRITSGEYFLGKYFHLVVLPAGGEESGRWWLVGGSPGPGC